MGNSRRALIVFAIASFLNDLGSDMIQPLWPLYVREVMGASMVVLGFIDGLGNAIVSISQAVSGYLSDRIKRRKIFIWIGYLMGGTSRLGYSIAPTWHWLIPFKCLDRAGKMRGAPRDAMIADESTNETRGKNFGILRAMDNAGALCGVILGILLIESIGYRSLFMLAAIPSILGAILIILFIKEQQKGTDGKEFSLKNINKNFRLFLIASSVFGLGNFSYSFLLIAARGAGFKTTSIPVLYLIYTFIAALMSLPFGKLADSLGRKKTLLISFIFFMLMCLGFSVIDSNPVLVITLFVLYGLHLAAIEPAQKALASEIVPQAMRGTALGTLQMATGILTLPSSIIAGFLWEKSGNIYPFIFSFLLTAVASVLLMFVNEEKQSS